MVAAGSACDWARCCQRHRVWLGGAIVAAGNYLKGSKESKALSDAGDRGISRRWVGGLVATPGD